MNAHDQATRADMLRKLHVPGDPLVVVNVWDVASARVVASQPATRALATASWSISAAMGYPDGGGMPLEVALLTARRIVESTEFPVTVDFEKGYADSPAGLRHTTRQLIETGAVGLNIEDSVGGEDRELWSIDDAAARVAAVRDAAVEAGLPLVINARTDTLVGGGTVDDAIARGRAYLDAGADCVFVLGAIGPHLDAVVQGIPGPVSALAGAGAPSIRELAAAGVARVSFGPGPMGVAYAALARLVRDLSGNAQPPADLAFRPGARTRA
jgi:2-methylisocitrate lyase-like PEP mutase family enzyme